MLVVFAVTCFENNGPNKLSSFDQFKISCSRSATIILWRPVKSAIFPKIVWISSRGTIGFDADNKGVKKSFSQLFEKKKKKKMLSKGQIFFLYSFLFDFFFFGYFDDMFNGFDVSFFGFKNFGDDFFSHLIVYFVGGIFVWEFENWGEILDQICHSGELTIMRSFLIGDVIGWIWSNQTLLSLFCFSQFPDQISSYALPHTNSIQRHTTPHKFNTTTHTNSIQHHTQIE